MNLYCLVMAGGKGTRFWPESTSKRPKQYLSLLSSDSLLAETLSRFEGLIPASSRYIVTVKEQEVLASESSNGRAAEDALIFEPSGRNTAPCILLSIASLEAKGLSDDDVVAIVPSDHVILNHKGFKDTVEKAGKVALENKSIVTIGITPNFPHTGFGYIQKSDEMVGDAFKVQAFKEKPNSDLAKEYVASGKYFWNAGMFVATLGTLKSEFQKHSPETFEFYGALKDSLSDFSKLSDVYNKVPADSIDYAIMEKSSNVMVVPAEFDWNDLGSWDALEAVIEKTNGNTIASATGVYNDGAEGNIIFAPGKHVSLINVNNLIVVSNENNVVILPKTDSQKVKEIVASLKGTRFEDLL